MFAFIEKLIFFKSPTISYHRKNKFQYLFLGSNFSTVSKIVLMLKLRCRPTTQYKYSLCGLLLQFYLINDACRRFRNDQLSLAELILVESDVTFSCVRCERAKVNKIRKQDATRFFNLYLSLFHLLKIWFWKSQNVFKWKKVDNEIKIELFRNISEET